MECRQVVAILPAFLDDRLSSVEAAAVEDHVAACETCWAHLKRLTDEDQAATADLAAELAEPALMQLMQSEPPPLPDDFTDQVMARIDWAPVKRPWWARALHHPAVSFSYAAAATFLIISVAQKVFLWEQATNGFGSVILQGQVWLELLSARLSAVAFWMDWFVSRLF
jgi:anti-sigma factor RsiW